MRIEPVFYIKQGDRSPELEVQLLDQYGEPIELTSQIVLFRMTPKIDNAEMEIIDGAQGVVKYVWQAGDTDEAGTFAANVIVDYGWGADGRIQQTFPSDGNLVIKIGERLRLVGDIL